jgi:hypothetical protein
MFARVSPTSILICRILSKTFIHSGLVAGKMGLPRPNFRPIRCYSAEFRPRKPQWLEMLLVLVRRRGQMKFAGEGQAEQAEQAARARAWWLAWWPELRGAVADDGARGARDGEGGEDHGLCREMVEGISKNMPLRHFPNYCRLLPTCADFCTYSTSFASSPPS